MQLSDIRTEVLNNGFDPVLFGTSRVNAYINEGYQLVCQRVQFYTDEGTQDFSTANGTITYAWPTDFARLRDLRDTTRNIRLLPVTLRQIDDSGVVGQGPPMYYALDGANFHIWPTPDNVYTLECRYWKLPALLVNDTDVPIIPAQWHGLLWRYATACCYRAEDDFNTGAQWEADFEKMFAQFAAEVKFPDSETPDVARSYWDSERSLSQKGWTLWGWL